MAAAATSFVTKGRRDAPAVLLVHPLGANHEFWNEVSAILADRFFTVACDLRGARGGQLPLADRPWSVGDHARDLRAIRESLELRELVCVGCAIGSLVSAAYAASDSVHVRGLILSNTTPRLGLESKERTEGRIERVRRDGIGALLPEVIDLAFRNLPKDDRYHAYLEAFRQNEADGYAAIALGMIGTDVSDELRSLSCPAMVVVGEHDILLPPPLSQQVHELIAGSEFVMMKSAAHFAPYQAPERFAALVADFIDRRICWNV